MNEQNLNLEAIETNNESATGGYQAPRMFAVGTTIDLIQGAQNKVLDYPGSWGVYD